jgi:hypothetical protein
MTKKPDSLKREHRKRSGDPQSDREAVFAKLGLPDGLSVAGRADTSAADPYNQKLEDAPKRRSLDDMRRLSEAIKGTNKWQPQGETSAFAKQLMALRVDLERSLRGAEGLHEEAILSADKQPMQRMAKKLRGAVDHIKGALEDLIPPEGV